MRYEKIFVTPDVAKRFLANPHPAQRKIRQQHVRRLAADMQAGAYTENPRSCGVDHQGRLFDGQHRLAALVLTGIPRDLWFALDCSDEAVAATDQNAKPRGIHDMLAFKGVRMTRLAAGIVRTILTSERATERSWKSLTDVSTGRLAEFAEENRRYAECAALLLSPRVVGINQLRRGGRGSQGTHLG